MLIFEQLVGRGFMVLDPVRKVLVFNREVVGKFPAIREAKMEEFRWLVGEWSAMNKVRATPSSGLHRHLFLFVPALRSRYAHLYYRIGRDGPAVFNV